jgi:alkanesulfonate monooxygenase SsuD/methylene tetrahydromethanopterin reductase-like flavin-dependent oxidoreductase (luciferase family)
MSEQIKFGFCVPIFANPGMLFFRTPNYKKLDWDSIKKTILLCEELRYDSAFVADHVFLGKEGDIWECIATMSALLAITKKIEIIPIHLCSNFRTPSIVAKTFCTMSHISNGRVAMFYDYGWRKAEFDQYGIEFGMDDNERIARMAEGIEIIKGMLEQDRYSFKGKYYQTKDAICNPKPVNPIPVWMGEANNPNMIKQIVKFADVFNSMPCSLENFQKKKNLVIEECRRQNRNPQTMGWSLETQVLIRESEEEVDAELAKYKKLIRFNDSRDDDILDQLKATNPSGADFNAPESLKKEFMIGTPDQIKEQIDAFVQKGVSHFMLWFMDYPEDKGIRLFSEMIMPHF